MLVLVGCATMPAHSEAGVEAEVAQNKPIVLVYLPGWVQTTPQMLPLDKLTHICHAFIKADSEGHLILESTMPNKPVIDAAHEYGVKVLISIGGSESDAFFVADHAG